jgi:hypothetical protein
MCECAGLRVPLGVHCEASRRGQACGIPVTFPSPAARMLRTRDQRPVLPPWALEILRMYSALSDQDCDRTCALCCFAGARPARPAGAPPTGAVFRGVCGGEGRRRGRGAAIRLPRRLALRHFRNAGLTGERLTEANSQIQLDHSPFSACRLCGALLVRPVWLRLMALPRSGAAEESHGREKGARFTRHATVREQLHEGQSARTWRREKECEEREESFFARGWDPTGGRPAGRAGTVPAARRWFAAGGCRADPGPGGAAAAGRAVVQLVLCGAGPLSPRW